MNRCVAPDKFLVLSAVLYLKEINHRSHGTVLKTRWEKLSRRVRSGRNGSGSCAVDVGQGCTRGTRSNPTSRAATSNKTKVGYPPKTTTTTTGEPRGSQSNVEEDTQQCIRRRRKGGRETRCGGERVLFLPQNPFV